MVRVGLAGDAIEDHQVPSTSVRKLDTPKSTHTSGYSSCLPPENGKPGCMHHELITFPQSVIHCKTFMSFFLTDSIVFVEATLAAIQREFREFVRWFELGLQLNIPEDDLKAIAADHVSVRDRSLHMFMRWKELEKPTWNRLVTALLNIGKRTLAEKLAKNHGIADKF